MYPNAGRNGNMRPPLLLLLLLLSNLGKGKAVSVRANSESHSLTPCAAEEGEGGTEAFWNVTPVREELSLFPRSSWAPSPPPSGAAAAMA